MNVEVVAVSFLLRPATKRYPPVYAAQLSAPTTAGGGNIRVLIRDYTRR